MKQIARKNIKLQSWVNFISGLTFLAPIIAILYKHTGLSMVEIVLISNVMTAGIFIFELPTSVFADTVGRRHSLLLAVYMNLVSTLFVLIFPSFWGFVFRAGFAALYWAFWSGTGQAFLVDNLEILGEKKSFGKVFGKLVFWGEAGMLVTPLIAGGVLKLLGDFGYTVLAGIDVLFAIVLVGFVLKMKEVSPTIKKKAESAQTFLKHNWETTTTALRSTFGSKKLRLFMIFRMLTSDVLFIGVIALPILAIAGMEDWISGIVVAGVALGSMIASKYAYTLGEKFTYTNVWVFSKFVQGAILITAGFFSQHWILFAILFIALNFCQGFEFPAWNQVLVEQVPQKIMATTRSIIMAVYALYITLGKHFLSFFFCKMGFNWTWNFYICDDYRIWTKSEERFERVIM